MTRNDGKTCGLGTALALVALLLLAGLPARAAELTVAEYVDLTISRLELARRTWSEEGRSPVETEEATLFESWGTTAGAYYRYGGDHAKEIEGFLEENTEKSSAIEALSREIERLIEQAEVQP
jgi:hypothetical protein